MEKIEALSLKVLCFTICDLQWRIVDTFLPDIYRFYLRWILAGISFD